MATPPPSGEFDLAKLYLWVKGLESKANSVIRELDILKNDLVKKNLDLRKEVKILSEDILALRHEHEKSLQKMDLVIQELKQTAGKEEVMILKKYLDLWSPLNFVSQRDLDRALQSKMEIMKVSEKNDLKDNSELMQNNSTISNRVSETNKKEKHLPFA